MGDVRKLMTAADQTTDTELVVVGQLTVNPFSIELFSDRNDGIDTLSGCMFRFKTDNFQK